eukprot:2025710-Amphidinium_carterae.2
MLCEDVRPAGSAPQSECNSVRTSPRGGEDYTAMQPCMLVLDTVCVHTRVSTLVLVFTLSIRVVNALRGA